MGVIWREGYRAVVVPGVEIINGVTEGVVIGTSQPEGIVGGPARADGYYDVHIEDDSGARATYRNLQLARPADHVYRPGSY